MTNRLSELDDGLGKDRSPASVLGLSIITLGIYFLVWYYKINNEIRRHDPTIQVTPGLSVVAMCLPIFNLVSGYSTAARIRQMQLDEGATQTISPIIALLLQIFLGIGFPLYIASQMREHWHAHRLPNQPQLASRPVITQGTFTTPMLAASSVGKCSAGHQVWVDQAFCSQCGEKVDQSVAKPQALTRDVSYWCENCEQEFDLGSKFCAQCGGTLVEVNIWECVECNGPIGLEDKFCPTCGESTE
jgi:hypothetical protein